MGDNVMPNRTEFDSVLFVALSQISLKQTFAILIYPVNIKMCDGVVLNIDY